jgi:hypothetical protein
MIPIRSPAPKKIERNDDLDGKLFGFSGARRDAAQGRLTVSSAVYRSLFNSAVMVAEQEIHLPSEHDFFAAFHAVRDQIESAKLLKMQVLSNPVRERK